ncbi:SET domain-containing protein SmydA-8-like [Anthonomus grandis grandis]|uniref:SET domain-containing protein SmydA-8-like n=1 Tax=Anthonomus grandis grandis TaxID=2921223 RepID=UPI0021656BD9|nr:SET domain-containing protein SmydA-8-like [Anthonomus grandis grandis]
MSRSHRRNKRSHSSKTSKSDSTINSFLDDISEESFEGPKYEVKTSKVMGRFIVSKKDIRPGEVIISEGPLVVGPCTDCKVQCLGCYKNLENEKKFTRCHNCGWPICSRKCSGLRTAHGHSEIECTILEECKSASLMNFTSLEDLRLHYQAIVPLRCLILKTTDPSSYSILMDMESHNEIRKNIPDLWELNQTRVVDRIIKDWRLTEFTEEEIHTICGILEVNAFEIGQQGVNIRGLYATAFLLSHDCVPNTNHTDEENTYHLTIRASTRIPKGYPVTLSYAYTLQCTQKRREHLLENKFFECRCKRCADPTELGTYTGALICPKCDNGLVLCDNPLNFDSTWSCIYSGKQCPGYVISANSMKLLLNRISQEADQIDSNDIKAMEHFLQKYRNVLHPTHYLCLAIKISLSQVYGRISGYIIQELNEKPLLRKKELCEEILSVFDVIEPGFTRIRGVTLYEIHAPMMILLTRQIESQPMSKKDIKAALKDILKYLTEAKIILSYEPIHSSEGIMGSAANDALKQIKDWEKIVGKIR